MGKNRFVRYGILGCICVFLFGIGCGFLVHNKRAKEEPYFVVFIPSYNNELWCEKNLCSVFSQTYPHWHIHYVDDCSDDATYQRVMDCIKKHNMEERCTVVRNKERRLAMANFYTAIHQQNPYHIIVTIDGDDWLAHNDVLQHLAHIYQDPNVWLTYGSLQVDPQGSWSHACAAYSRQVIKHRLFKAAPWRVLPIRTFYAKLFQNIRSQDVMYQGQFVPSACDVAMMMPMLEMASRGHIRYNDEVMYTYNRNNVLNDDRVNLRLQQDMVRFIRHHQPVYPALAHMDDEVRLDSSERTVLHVLKNTCSYKKQKKYMRSMG